MKKLSVAFTVGLVAVWLLVQLFGIDIKFIFRF